MILTKPNIESVIFAEMNNPNLSLEYLSDSLKVSKVSLWRFCKKHYNLSPKKLIDGIRLLLIIKTTYLECEHIYTVANRFGIDNRSTLYNLTNKYLKDCPKTVEINIISDKNNTLYFKDYLSSIPISIMID